MHWYKVKTILIILFALINAFLIWITVSGNIQQIRNEQQMEAALIKALQNSQIGVSEDIIPNEQPKMRVVPVENVIDDSAAFAEKIFKTPVEALLDEEGNEYYRSESKTLYIENGSFRYSNSVVAASAVLGESHVKKAAALLTDMGIDLSSARRSVEGDTVIFTFYIDGKPLFINDIKVKMSDTDISEASGYIITFSKSVLPEKTVGYAQNALVDFLQDPSRPQIPTTIKSIDLGFSILLGGTSVHFKSAEAVPTYRILTGGGDAYYYVAGPE